MPRRNRYREVRRVETPPGVADDRVIDRLVFDTCSLIEFDAAGPRALATVVSHIDEPDRGRMAIPHTVRREFLPSVVLTSIQLDHRECLIENQLFGPTVKLDHRQLAEARIIDARIEAWLDQNARTATPSEDHGVRNHRRANEMLACTGEAAALVLARDLGAAVVTDDVAAQAVSQESDDLPPVLKSHQLVMAMARGAVEWLRHDRRAGGPKVFNVTIPETLDVYWEIIAGMQNGPESRPGSQVQRITRGAFRTEVNAKGPMVPPSTSMKFAFIDGFKYLPARTTAQPVSLDTGIELAM